MATACTFARASTSVSLAFAGLQHQPLDFTGRLEQVLPQATNRTATFHDGLSVPAVLAGQSEVMPMDALIKRFDSPDETRTFEKGKFDVIKIGNMTIGRASYEPGWKWSEHVGAATGATSCEVDHIGLVLSGHAKALMNDGRELDLTPGDFFSIGPGHDSWVVGNEPYVSLHFMGADSYAQ